MALISAYRMSFSTGGLFFHESIELAGLFESARDWDLVKKEAGLQNLLQSRTEASSTRAIREIVWRLQMLSKEELELLLEGSQQEQKYLLWIAICRTYPFIKEFAQQILREFFVSMRGELQYEDFDYFYNKKSDLHPELDEISDSTRDKLRQVLFRMMREADLLTVNNQITPAIFTPNLISVIGKNCGDDLLLFPVYEGGIRSMSR